MAKLADVLVYIVGASMLAIGIGFWFALDAMMPQFALSTISDVGRSNIRADNGCLFLTLGTMAGYAVWNRSRTAALVCAMMFLVGLTGRFLTVALDGLDPAAIGSMFVEGGSAAILLWARSLWPTPTLGVAKPS